MKRIIYCLLMFAAIRTMDVKAATLIEDMASPKLKVFLNEHPGAKEILHNVLSSYPSNISIQIVYFYKSGNSTSIGYHNSHNKDIVDIMLKENVSPLDEFLAMFHEVVDIKNDFARQPIGLKARDGSITKTEFVRAILLTEFDASQRTLALIKKMALSETEIKASIIYQKFVKIPNSFDAYVEYCNSSSHGQPLEKYYGDQYDRIRAGDQ